MRYELGENREGYLISAVTTDGELSVIERDPDYDEGYEQEPNYSIKLSRDNARELVNVLNEWLEGRMTDDRLPRCRARGLTIREDGSPYIYIDLADLATTLPPAECAELLVALSGKKVSAHNVERWLAERKKHA